MAMDPTLMNANPLMRAVSPLSLAPVPLSISQPNMNVRSVNKSAAIATCTTITTESANNQGPQSAAWFDCLVAWHFFRLFFEDKNRILLFWECQTFACDVHCLFAFESETVSAATHDIFQLGHDLGIWIVSSAAMCLVQGEHFHFLLDEPNPMSSRWFVPLLNAFCWYQIEELFRLITMFTLLPLCSKGDRRWDHYEQPIFFYPFFELYKNFIFLWF